MYHTIVITTIHHQGRGTRAPPVVYAARRVCNTSGAPRDASGAPICVARRSCVCRRARPSAARPPRTASRAKTTPRPSDRARRGLSRLVARRGEPVEQVVAVADTRPVAEPVQRDPEPGARPVGARRRQGGVGVAAARQRADLAERHKVSCLSIHRRDDLCHILSRRNELSHLSRRDACLTTSHHRRAPRRAREIDRSCRTIDPSVDCAPEDAGALERSRNVRDYSPEEAGAAAPRRDEQRRAERAERERRREPREHGGGRPTAQQHLEKAERKTGRDAERPRGSGQREAARQWWWWSSLSMVRTYVGRHAMRERAGDGTHPCLRSSFQRRKWAGVPSVVV